MRLLLLLLSIVTSTISFALENKTNFDKPKKIEKTVLHKSQLTEGPVIKTAYHYDKAIVVEINDPGLIGTRVTLYNGPVKKIEYKAQDSIFYGLYHNLLFMTGADSFGEKQGLYIFKLDSEKEFFKVQYYGPHGLFLEKDQEKTMISYYKYFDLPCAEKSKLTLQCWKEFIKKNHFSKNLTMPKCSANSMVFIGIQTTLSDKTNIPDKLLLNRKPICSIMP